MTNRALKIEKISVCSLVGDIQKLGDLICFMVALWQISSSTRSREDSFQSSLSSNYHEGRDAQTTSGYFQ